MQVVLEQEGFKEFLYDILLVLRQPFHPLELVEYRLSVREKNIVYNKLDQPIMVQDSVQRTNGEWLFTKYDAFGRVAYTGRAADSRERRAVQTEVDALTVPLWAVHSGTANVIGGADVYYGNGAYPDSGSTTVLSEVLTINYYDNYGFDLGGGTHPGSVLGQAMAPSVKGLPTGGKVKVLDTGDWITAVTYYDKKGRPVYSYTENAYLGTTDIVETQLDFVGKPLRTRTSHTRNNGTIVTLDNYAYDHVGRLLSHTQCIGDENMGDSCPASGNLEENLAISGTINDLREATGSITVTNGTLLPGAHLRISNGSGEELIVYNGYDELGQLAQKKVGGAPGTDYGTTLGLQTIDYGYNVRGWLRSINNGVATNGDLFGFKLNYNTVEHGGTPLFNGNIAETAWVTLSINNTSNPVSTNYRYLYDSMNRITSAHDNTGNYNVSGISYDKMGNIMSLTRNGWQDGSFANMDILDYDYDSGNKLLKVSDTGDGAYGFRDGTNTNDDFEYDINGNLKVDRNKGITSITYNHLNLPVQVDFGNDNIQYVYVANGIKLKKTVNDNGSSISTEYSGNYIYKTVGGNNELQFIDHSEGYVTPDGSNGWQYVYNYKDHLGNIKLSYADADGNGSIDPANEIIEESNYYPFGLKHQGYNGNISPLGNSTAQLWKYNGQENEEALGLNVTEMTFRQYDPAIGRFNVIDPAAGMAGNWTPYRFGFNNPVLYSDPLGLWEKRNGSWYTDDKKDIERFLSMLQIENDFSGGVSGAQMDTFIKEEWQGSGGRLSDGSILLDGETLVADSSGKYGDFSPRQADHIGQQVEKYGSNPYNEKSTGTYGHWAYSYKYHRERNYYFRGGQGLSGEALSGFVYSLTSDYMSNRKFWLGRNLKFYDASWGGNGATGGKNKYAAKWAKGLGAVSTVLGVYGAYSTYEDYQKDKLSGLGASYIGATDAAGLRNIYGASVSIGTSGGRAIVESDWYFNTFLSDYNW